jgi:hypothetical protein
LLAWIKTAQPDTNVSNKVLPCNRSFADNAELPVCHNFSPLNYPGYYATIKELMSQDVQSQWRKTDSNGQLNSDFLTFRRTSSGLDAYVGDQLSELVV